MPRILAWEADLLRSRADPWLACEPQLNSRLIKPLLRFYQQRAGDAALEKLLAEQGTTVDVVEDPDRWFSAELVLQLNRAMVAATGDSELIYRCGRALAQPGMLGPERLLMRGLLNPRRVYESLGHITARYSRITHWKMEWLGPGRLRATFVRDDAAVDDVLFCGNRRGVLEAVPEVFGLQAARVDHPVCIHRGDDRCVYEARWIDQAAWSRPSLVAAAGLGVAAAAAWGVASVGLAALLATVAAVYAGVGVAGLLGPRARRDDIPVITGASADELQSLLQRNTRRVHELQALQRVVEVTRLVLDEDDLIERLFEQLTALGYTRALLLRAATRHDPAAPARSEGFGKDAALVEGLGLARGGPDERLFGKILREGHTVLVTDPTEYGATLLPRNRELLETIGTRSFVAAPIEGRGEHIGLLLVVRSIDAQGDEEEPLSLRDRDLLQSIAAGIGAGLSNARLFRQVEEQLLINRKFRQYLPEAAADEVRRNPDSALRLGGREEELAVMFCDVAGFTRMSTACAPEEVVRGLNWWFGIGDPLIDAAGGIVDKRIGDGVLVVFRVIAGEAHPVVRAVAAAVGMQKALDAQRSRLTLEAPAFSAMRVRHAIHFGPVVLGNIGTEARMEYTVIGDAVNTCARVEELTPAGEVWLTEDAVRAAGADALPGAVRVSEVVLRGRSEATALWAVREPTAAQDHDGGAIIDPTRT